MLHLNCKTWSKIICLLFFVFIQLSIHLNLISCNNVENRSGIDLPQSALSSQKSQEKTSRKHLKHLHQQSYTLWPISNVDFKPRWQHLDCKSDGEGLSCWLRRPFLLKFQHFTVRVLPLCFAAFGPIVSDTRGANVCLRKPLLGLNQSFGGVHWPRKWVFTARGNNTQ